MFTLLKQTKRMGIIMNQSVLYLECNSGISGDMTVAALLDLGADRQVLLNALASLPLTGYSIEIKDVYKSGLRACDFNVVLEHDNHDHDMEYLHGHAHVHAEGSDAQDSIHNHTHTASAPHDPHTHVHTHEARNLRDITEIINAGKLTDRARALALRIFRILAQAEASVHGKSVDEVHFHEVGAVDSIVDIVAVAVCLDQLDPARVVVSPLTDGSGQIRCQHGLIPVPVPAVTAIVTQNDLTLKFTDIEGELVTPTGAAIAAALQSGHNFSTTLPAEFRIRKIGLGAGKRDYATTGVLRAMLLEPQCQAENVEIPPVHGPGKINDKLPSHQSNCDSYSDGSQLDNMPPVSRNRTDDFDSPSAKALHDNDDSTDTILSLETNIDDCTGEALSFTMQELFAHGALDVFYVPIYMKKNRPAYLLRVLCRIADRTVLESVIFKNTTTIGIRAQEMQRTKLPRQIVSIETPWGKADVKCCTHNGETWCYPENDSVVELARRNQTGFPDMYHRIQEFASKTFGN